MLKKTKIICTMGPTADTVEIIKEMLDSGMNCARFNFSHGTHEEQRERIKKVRKAARRANKIIALLLDTKGPEIRLGKFAAGSVMLKKDEQLVLSQSDEPGDEHRVAVSHKDLYKDVHSGDRILLSDGLVELQVERVEDKDIVTTVLNDGVMSDRKRVAVPGIPLSLPPLSEHDKEDLLFGIENEFDFVAASFIQRASDVEHIRQFINDNGGAGIEIISKIENLEGVNNIDEIIEASDGIMVARGDLGVEIPAEEVPLIQKDIVAKCHKKGKIVVVATQMLESMTVNPRPTRAEASDVANAVLDGTDAIMLSGETANGKYPVEAVKMMARIAQSMEGSLHYREMLTSEGYSYTDKVINATAHSAVQLSLELQAKSIFVSTITGNIARRVSYFRPKADILVFSYSEFIAKHLSLNWGVHVMNGSIWEDAKDPTGEAIVHALREKFVSTGDIVVAATASQTIDGSMSASIEVRTVDE